MALGLLVERGATNRFQHDYGATMPQTEQLPTPHAEQRHTTLAECGPNVSKLTRACALRAVPLAAICVDPALQGRAAAQLDSGVVDQYAARYAAGDDLPEVVLFREGETYHPADGN